MILIKTLRPVFMLFEVKEFPYVQFYLNFQHSEKLNKNPEKYFGLRLYDTIVISGQIGFITERPRHETVFISYRIGLQLFKRERTNLISFIRAQKNYFLPGSKSSAFISFYTLPSSFTIPTPFCLFTFLSFCLPLAPSFLYLFSPSFRFFFLFPFILPGKLEHFSYLPGSTATTLLRFLNPELHTVFVFSFRFRNENVLTVA